MWEPILILAVLIWFYDNRKTKELMQVIVILLPRGDAPESRILSARGQNAR